MTTWRLPLVVGGCALGVAAVLLMGEPNGESGPGQLSPASGDSQDQAFEPSAPRLPKIQPGGAPVAVAMVGDEAPSASGLVLLETGEQIFTRDRAIAETSKTLLGQHMPKPTTFVRSYTRWPDELTEETSRQHFGRDLTQAEIAGIQSIHDQFLPDLLALADLMRGEYGDVLRTVERTRSYNLDRIDASQANARAPQNHNVITMPGWRATYPVGYDTYPHLRVTADAASSLRKKRDRAVASYLASTR